MKEEAIATIREYRGEGGCNLERIAQKCIPDFYPFLFSFVVVVPLVCLYFLFGSHCHGPYESYISSSLTYLPYFVHRMLFERGT